jgi:ribosomal protein L21
MKQEVKKNNSVIIMSGNKQYFLTDERSFYVDRLDQEEGSVVEYKNLLNNEVCKFLVQEHLKGEKISIVKFIRRKRYKRNNGFRPYLTKLKPMFK